jgi:Zn-dependent protease with chaperone function
MKKLLFMVSILLLASCAGTQSKYVIPQRIIDRPISASFPKAVGCMHYDSGFNVFLMVTGDKKPNAMSKGNNVYLTEGVFDFDDDTIMFITTHELAHIKLNHVRNRNAVSLATTGAFVVAGAIVPGVGLLNWVANPAIVNNYSKPQELEADKLASETLVSCFNISVEKQVKILQSMHGAVSDAGGFWDKHPSWDDRIKNIESH